MDPDPASLSELAALAVAAGLTLLLAYFDLLVRQTSLFKLRSLLRPPDARGVKDPERLEAALRVGLVLASTAVLALAGDLARGRPMAALVGAGWGLAILAAAILLLPPLLHRPGAPSLTGAELALLRAIDFVLAPIAWPLAYLTRLRLRADREETEAERETRAEEEIQSFLEAAEEEGIFEQDEGEMIQSVLDFGDTVVREVMVPRTDVVAVPVTVSRADLIEVVVTSGHSRFPVYRDSIDDIIGVVHAKDLLRPVAAAAAAAWDLTPLLRPPYFIPANKPVRQLLSELRAKALHMAVVVDEYGGVEGIVSLEDLIEELVGDIQDEYDLEEEEIRTVGDGRLEIDAAVRLEDLGERLGVEFPDGDYETLGGFIVERLGRIPEAGVFIDEGAYRFTVTEADNRRIKTVLGETRARLEAGGESPPGTP